MPSLPLRDLANFTEIQSGDKILIARAGPDDGLLPPEALLVQVSPSSPTTGATVSSAAWVDENLYLTPAGPLAALSLALPAAADARAGQIKRLYSSQNIEALSVSVSGGGSIIGAPPSIVAGEVYLFQCVSTSGSGVWVYMVPAVAVVAVTTITGTSHTLVTANQNALLRFTAGSAKDLIIPVADADFAAVPNTLFTFRNAGLGDITIAAESLGVTINNSAGSEIISPHTTGQMLYLGANVWDIQ